MVSETKSTELILLEHEPRAACASKQLTKRKQQTKMYADCQREEDPPVIYLQESSHHLDVLLVNHLHLHYILIS